MKYRLVLLLALLGVGSLQAQHTKKTKSKDSEMIVMPKDEFIDIVAKAVMERKKNDPNFDAESFRIKSLQQQKNGNLTASNFGSDYEYRLNRLENQVRDLMLLIAGSKTSTGSNVTYLPATSEVGQNANDTTIVNVDNSALEKEISRLVAETERLKSKMQNTKPAQLTKSAYDGQANEIFFANNRYNLSTEAVATIEHIVSILKADSELDIMVKGFASKVGGSLHNQELSLKRCDNVKQAFISKGIAPGRVLTTYHGEDLSNRSEAESRRVDVIILDTRK